MINYLKVHDLLKYIDKDKTREYLITKGWVSITEQIMKVIKEDFTVDYYTLGSMELWSLYDEYQLLQPLNKNAHDYDLRLIEMLQNLSVIENKSVFDIFNDLNKEYEIKITVKKKNESTTTL
jgi:hypothetical protein